jgi:RNA polymerase sigma factor (sigma-70 family)
MAKERFTPAFRPARPDRRIHDAVPRTVFRQHSEDRAESTHQLQLIEGLNAGDQRALGQIIFATEQRMRAFIQKKFPDFSDEKRDDILQETYITLMEKTRAGEVHFDVIQQVESWLITVLQRKGIDEFRVQRRRGEVSIDNDVEQFGDSGLAAEIVNTTEDTLAEKESPFENVVLRHEGEQRAIGAEHLQLQRLARNEVFTPNERYVLEEVVVNERPYQEVSDELGVTVGNLHVIMHRAREKVTTLARREKELLQNRTSFEVTQKPVQEAYLLSGRKPIEYERSIALALQTASLTPKERTVLSVRMCYGDEVLRIFSVNLGVRSKVFLNCVAQDWQKFDRLLKQMATYLSYRVRHM